MQPDDAMRLGSLALEAPVEDEHHEVGRAAPRRLPGWLPLIPLGLFLGFALLGPLMIPISPTQQDLPERLQPPAWAGGSWDHPLGSDGLGRDLLSRLAKGARFSSGWGCNASIYSGDIRAVS